MQEKSDTLISTEDKKILSLLEELENDNNMENSSSKIRLTVYLYSSTVFNVSKRILIEVDIEIIEKDLDAHLLKIK